MGLEEKKITRKMNNMDFLMESFYLDGLEIIRLKKSKKLYLFCGYDKDSILNKAKSLTNYAYESEMYLLGRTILPEYKNVGLFDILDDGIFISLNEDGNLDEDSLYNVLYLKKDSYDKIGKMKKEDFSLWQTKRKLLDKTSLILQFFTKDEALDILLKNKTYEISAEKDEILLNQFYDIFEKDCRKLGLDASYYIKYNKTDKTDSNKYPFNYGYTIERLDDTLYFYKVKYSGLRVQYGTCSVFDKYSGRRELYGKCSVFDKKEVVNLFLARNWNRMTL